MKRVHSFIIIALLLYTAGCSPGTIPDHEPPPATEQGCSIYKELADFIAAEKERISARPTGLEEEPIKEEDTEPEPVGTPRKETAEQPQPQPKPEKEDRPEKPEPEPQPARFAKEESLLIQWANETRFAEGREPLAVDPNLCTAARAKSQDMADHDDPFDHATRTYPDFQQFLKKFKIGYNWVGENIAFSKPNLIPTAIHNRWLNSDCHRKNMLNVAATHIGVGIARAEDGTYYYTQLLVGR